MRDITVLCLLTAAGLSAQSVPPSSPPRDWKLPASLAVKQDGPQTWRFLCDYYNLDVKGRLMNRERYSGLYTRGLAGGMARWNNVTVATNTDGSDQFANAKPSEFMEGFSYPLADITKSTQAEFFRGFPPMAMKERNLVWDTIMVESFGHELLEKLKLNTPYRVPDTADISLAGVGNFHHKDLQLVWTGISQRNGVECAVIDYRAFFNQLDVSIDTLQLVGRSHYWGQIWVSLATKRIEYATLYEDVLGELTMPALPKPMTISVFRIGTFEPVSGAAAAPVK